MFTGIVETTGRVQGLRDGAPSTRRLVVSTDLDLTTIPLGGSVAVNGVCLTLVARRGRRFEADLGPETLARTTLGHLALGDDVHLERPLRAGDPLGGHLVAGHVDGVGRVVRAAPDGDALVMDIQAPAEVAPYLVPKGSISVDGVSLTVNTVRGDLFSVTLIPHTLAVTLLARRSAGALVNLEADLMAKQIDRLLTLRLASAPPTTTPPTARPRRERKLRAR